MMKTFLSAALTASLFTIVAQTAVAAPTAVEYLPAVQTKKLNGVQSPAVQSSKLRALRELRLRNNQAVKQDLIVSPSM